MSSRRNIPESVQSLVRERANELCELEYNMVREEKAFYNLHSALKATYLGQYVAIY